MAPLWHDRDLAARARYSRRARLLGENARCADCKERDALVLRREANGEILCLNCRALRKAPKKLNIWDWSFRSCTTCLFMGPLDRECGGLFERHHTVGRANLPQHTAWLCRNCHAKVTELQRASDVDLRVQSGQLDRFVQSLNSAMCEVNVAAVCISERVPATWWQGFKEFTPTLLDGAVAMLQVVYLPPGEGPS